MKKQAGKNKQLPKIKHDNSVKSSGRNELGKQLREMIEEIDEEGLAFLINQARVILHNMQVDKVNKELRALETIDRGISKVKQEKGAFFAVREAENKSHFILVLNKTRKFLTLEEMRKLVRVCQSCEDAQDASARLYNWLARNRTDILADAEIKNKGVPLLAAMYETLKARYKVKDEAGAG